MESDESPKCPVCQAGFRGSGTCSRCGAELDSLMLLMAKACQLREDARRALQAGDYERAQRLALEAQATCSTQRGEDLRLLSSWGLAQTPFCGVCDFAKRPLACLAQIADAKQRASAPSRRVTGGEESSKGASQHDVCEVVPMPWLTDEDSVRHNKLAQGKLGEVWRKVANETLERTGDEGRAVREANAAIDRLNEKWSEP